MARTGVTQVDVDAAADALVLNGERPTVDRIRARLGKGSPNNVSRLLEAWWQTLGSRLMAANARLVLPNAPEAVATLAAQWWEVALAAARIQAEADLQDARERLAAEVSAVAEVQERMTQTREAERNERDAAVQARQLAEGRLTEALRLAEVQSTQLDELRLRHAQLDARMEEGDAAVLQLRERLETQTQAAAAERDALHAHIQATENRAHSEIDRAREEAKRLQRDNEAAARAHRSALDALEGQLATAHASLRQTEAANAATERELATLRAHNAQLHEQITKALSRPAVSRKTVRPTSAATKQKENAGPRANARKLGASAR